MKPEILAQLTPCPRTGGSVHRYLYASACRMHKMEIQEEEQISVLAEAVLGCGRDVPRQEIEDAVRNGRRAVDNSSKGVWKGQRWPVPNREHIQKIVREGKGLTELEASSPVKWADGLPHTEEVIDHLFPDNPLLCAGPKKEIAMTQRREKWIGKLSKQQFIVPSPMTSVYGQTQSGTLSMRCLANT